MIVLVSITLFYAFELAEQLYQALAEHSGIPIAIIVFSVVGMLIFSLFTAAFITDIDNT